MTKQVNGCLLHPARAIIVGNGKTQGIFRKHFPILITEQVLLRFSLAYRHVFPENGNHLRTQWNHLNLSVLRVPIHNLPRPQIHIPVLNIPHCRRAAATI